MLHRFIIGTALIGLMSGLTFQLRASQQQNPESKPASDARLSFKLDEPIAMNVKSKPVHWHGHAYSLVEMGEATFQRENGRLTAKLSGWVTTFDDVDYHVSMALFDDAGQFLGAATATSDVQRIWLGYVGTQPRTLNFDFGVSQAYERAAIFSIAIAERKVLTPDDWQK